MAQQQPRRDQLFENAPRSRDERDRQRDRIDVRKNEDPDRWREEFGTRAGAPDPAAPYAYGIAGGGVGAAGYGAPYGTDATAGYGTTGTTGYGAGGGDGGGGGAGQWGRDASGVSGGGDTGGRKEQGQQGSEVMSLHAATLVIALVTYMCDILV